MNKPSGNTKLYFCCFVINFCSQSSFFSENKTNHLFKITALINASKQWKIVISVVFITTEAV